jgi:hypothetical protein
MMAIWTDRCWGIDGGRDGAALRIAEDGLTCLELVTWARAADPPALPIRAGDVVALEAAYVGKNPQSAMKLQLWRGKLIASFPAGIVLEEPLATSWRAKVFRGVRMRREVAKAAALELAHKHAIGLPDEYPDHVAEAWCMARWTLYWALAHLTPDGKRIRSRS